MNKGPSGIGFVGCALRSPATADGPQSGGSAPHTHGQRREVVVNGVRVKTVDIHAHCAVPGAMAVLDQSASNPELFMDDTATRIAAMDAQGIDVSALSINPYWYHAGRDAAAELIAIQNEALAEICAATPDRFVAFATAALQHPDLAVEQIEHNKSVLKAGMTFREVSEQSWKIPEEFVSNRYPSLIHGVGLADEYPSIKHWEDFDAKGYDGVLEAGTTLCVESLIAVEGGKEGVKLEEQVLITEDGFKQLSSYPLEEDWL